MFDFNVFKKTFGLDISDTVIRFSQVKKKGKEIILTSLNEVFLPEGVIFDGDIKDSAKLKDYILKLLKKPKGKKINTPFVNCVIPERKTFIKLIQVPKKRKAEISEAIKWESTQHIPMNPEEIYLDWQKIPQSNDKGDKLNILIAAAPKNIVDSYLKLLESINLTPVSLETESLATIRSIIPPQGKFVSPALIVDIGGDHTNLIIYDRGSIQFSSSVPFSGNSLTKVIAEKLNMSYRDAEKAKIIYGLENKKAKGEVRKILLPHFAELTNKIKDTENFYLNHFPESKKFKKIILSGGGAQLKRLDKYLANKLNIPAEKANPSCCINKKNSKIFPSQDRIPSFTTAIGLALRNIKSL